ncbi:hypothetical protein LguiA_009486 [Lonicera macranthoides]
MEPSNFVQYCCHWLLPALILHGDTSNLNWVAKIACQSSAALVKNHFVPIFSVCMALHCSKKSGSENGAAVLQSSILSIAKISENERDILIKKHMFIVEIHYKVTAAIHYRHKCNRLAAIEVLINVLGHRAAVSSTSK